MIEVAWAACHSTDIRVPASGSCCRCSPTFSDLDLVFGRSHTLARGTETLRLRLLQRTIAIEEDDILNSELTSAQDEARCTFSAQMAHKSSLA